MKTMRISQVVAGLLLVLGVGAVTRVVLSGPFEVSAGTLGIAGTQVTFGVYLDLLSASLLAFVASIALIVSVYAGRNLRGQRRLVRFGALLTLSFVSLSLMVTGASLPMIALGWTVSGLLLSGLVAHRAGPSAQRAGAAVRRQLLVGDALLWTGVVAAFVALPTLDRAELAGAVSGSTALFVAAAALGGAAVVRSALLPATGWLPLTAEAPSPVSAYLHAGVVNGAGVLVALLWPLFFAVPAVLGAFIVIGVVTVVVASLAAKTRPDVKGQLAASTSAQMGYMTIQLGLGLPAAAVLHLIGHGYYKAWMFLRAGGAVTRHRSTPARPALPGWERWLGIGVALAAVGGTVAFVMPRIIDTLAMLGPASVLPLLAASATAAVAVYALWARATLRRLTSTIIGVVASLATLGGYLLVLTWWDGVLAGALPEVPVWTTAAALAWLALVVLAGVGLVVLARHIGRQPDGRIAVRLLAASLARHDRRSGAAPVATTPVPFGADDDLLDPAMVHDLVGAAAQLVGPAFPLRAVVAANPLAGLEELPFIDAARVTERTWGARAFLPEQTYARLAQDGHIHQAALDAVTSDYVDAGNPVAAADLQAELLRWAEAEEPDAAVVPLTLSGRRDGGAGPMSRSAQVHDGLWTARVWGAATPPADGQLYARWRTAAAHGWGRSMGLADLAASLPAEPDAALAALLQRSGVRPAEWFEYLSALLTSAPGWAAHAAWRVRAGHPQAVTELLVVRMAHDLAIAGPAAAPMAPIGVPEPVIAMADPLVRRRIWQAALEQSYRAPLVASVVDAALSSAPRPGAARAQLMFCIDVRSERLRRHLEAAGPYETYGFAGFFGAAIRYRSEFGHDQDQCPVLLNPTHQVDASPLVTDTTVFAGRQAVGSAWTTPGAPFALAEATGVGAGVMSALHTLAPGTTTRWGHAGAPAQWHPAPGLERIERSEASAADLPVGFSVAELTDLAYGALHAIGLESGFAPLLVIAGHGATVQNNAFAAAYDCGACGGNAGLDNARILAYAINHPQVRAGLAAQGIVVPADTVATAALHDTTTDDLLIDQPAGPSLRAGEALAGLRTDAEWAARETNRERLAQLPGATADGERRQVHRRAGDWAEPCPEWGLAGNAAFVIGPRSLTRHQDLQGRVFLHSYDPASDGDAAVLTTILNAPVVVAQWINSQYYFSTVDAGHFGSGDKSTHNVVGDVGVITGAHGDLKVGLPWQSVFADEDAADAGWGQHQPLRLSVVAYADETAIQRIVAESATLSALVGNEWVSITAVSPVDGRARELRPDLRWAPVAPSPVAPVGDDGAQLVSARVA